jgi:hypothetical protein
LTVVVCGADEVVVVVVDPDVELPELVVRGLDDDVDLRADVLGLEYVAAGAGATTVGVVAALSAAEMESSVAWFLAASARLSVELLSALVHANAARIAVAAIRLRGLIFLSWMREYHSPTKHVSCHTEESLIQGSIIII